MATILDIYTKTPPKTGAIKTKGIDQTPIGTDNPRGETKPSLDLSKDETRLKKARGGVLKTKGIDQTPIGTDNPRGETQPSLDLSKNEVRLKKARGGVLKSSQYSQTPLLR